MVSWGYRRYVVSMSSNTSEWNNAACCAVLCNTNLLTHPYHTACMQTYLKFLQQA